MDLNRGIEGEEEDDYLLERNILLRNYQINLFEKAKQQNSIIYLPTGSGKTLIAIHVLCSKTEEIRRPFLNGGKRAFFLTTTKVMVNQVTEVLQTHTKFQVIGLTGDHNVDNWSANEWQKLLETNQVFVVTGEILKIILQFSFIRPSQISLLVLDECHHAMLNHPYRLVLNTMSNLNSDEVPLILGLTSVLLNVTPKITKVESQIRLLETALDATVITEPQFEEIMSFSANPVDKLLEYETDPSTPLTEYISQMYDRIIETLNEIILKPPPHSTIPEKGKEFSNKNKAKRIRNSFVNSKELFEELGIYGGSLSTLYYIIAFEKARLMSADTKEIQTLLYAYTEMLKLRRTFMNVIGKEETTDIIVRFSSGKVQKLLHAIKEEHARNKSTNLAILVFVKQRVTAMTLAFLLKRLKEAGGEFSFLKPEFIVSSSNYSKQTYFLGLRNDEIVKKFTCHSLNLLVATNLLEEGFDVSACHLVISFDFPLGYASYFQSRGRARNKESTYIMFAESKEVPKKRESLNNFKNIENEVFRVISQEYKNCLKDKEANEVLESIYIYGKLGPISVDGPTAIKIVGRYCSKLTKDRYAFLSPISWYLQIGPKKKGFLQLPTNSPLRDVIEGDWKETSRAAKRSVFLNTVKALFEMGELNHEMNPKSSEVKVEDFNFLFPNFKKEKIDKSLPQPGTSRREQKYKMKFSESLANCLPTPRKKVYLHVLNFTITFDKPPLDRKVIIYETLKHPVTFGLLTSKKLWKIFQFPLFLDMGQINCDLLVNYDEFSLTESEISDIKECHFALFKKVTKVLKNSEVFDNRNQGNSFFVVPLEKNEEDRFVINWELIRCDYCKNSTSALVRYNPSSARGIKRLYEAMSGESAGSLPSNALVPANAINGRLLWGINEGDKQSKFMMTETDYKYFIIIPNYRNQAYPQHYIVNKFCLDLSPLSPFPNVNYEDYVTYYKSNYLVDITNMTQPLLRVSPIYDCSNFNRPKQRKFTRERNKFYEEHLVPELCDVIPFDRKYYLKALLLPTALNRICHIYCVEEFRRKIISETGLGVCELPEGAEWPPMSINHLFVDEENEEAGLSSKKKVSSLPLTMLKDKTQVSEKIILDPERHMYDIGLCDLEFYVSNLKDSDLKEEMKEGNETSDIAKLMSLRNIPVPPLGTLKGGNSSMGPDLAQLVQASTSKSANDSVDYERLEILGDAFLKFGVTLFLLRNFKDNEGVLTSLKGKLVGNRNLMYCALTKGFPDVINVNDFVPSSDWSPPLFCIPERLVEGIITRNLDPAVIHRLDISFEEQFSGVLSEETFQKNEEILEGYEKSFEMGTSSLLGYKVIKDKTISDCVEAFVGAYLLALGIRGAFGFISWLQLLPQSRNFYSELIEKPYQHPSGPENESAVKTLLSPVFYSELEDILNYTFNDKAFLLEAITHPSYSKNRVTDCYERLELLGDAILDFLITSYVYEYCGHLGPGAVTDIRSSLVNNITFACLTVRYEFHKYLLSFSTSLTTAINNFVKFQASRNHVVDDNVLVLLEENDLSMAEAVQVPKALADIFEALAGAIYLDSGNSLETVWRVYYVMMKREIDEFTKTVPKTPVRLLHEICGDKAYFESEVVHAGLVMVSCTVYYDNEEIKSFGFGCNKKEAKRSSVKAVLNKILIQKK